MKELLARWASLEPAKCAKSSKNIFTIQANGEANNIYDPDSVNGLDLAWIQWAAQQAIIERGWSFELNYNPDCADPNSLYDAIVESYWSSDRDNIVVALLRAYLDTLEEAER